jgi:hypothetical protein
MRKILVRAAIALIALAPLCAAAATIKLQVVTVPGGSSPYLSTISATGALGGVYWNNTKNAALGFVLDGKHVIVLPKGMEGNLGSAVVPVGFGPFKSVFGYNNYLGSFTCFQFEFGIYVLGVPAGQAPPTQPGIAVNAKGTLVLDSPDGSGGYQYFFGTPTPTEGNLNQLTLDPSSYLVSISSAGLMSGSYNPGTPAVFTVDANNTVTSYSVPGSTATYGGFLNNHGQLAGTYKDASGLLHGFIERAGVYTSFDAPVRVSAMAVQAFSDPSSANIPASAYVAGVYTDQSGIQSGFLYHNGSFVPIPLPPGGTSITVVGVSKKGHVALNVVSNTGTTPYVAACSGQGC